jgi:hypothetical protein
MQQRVVELADRLERLLWLAAKLSAAPHLVAETELAGPAAGTAEGLKSPHRAPAASAADRAPLP